LCEPLRGRMPVSTKRLIPSAIQDYLTHPRNRAAYMAGAARV
jgi:hypothetical protein